MTVGVNTAWKVKTNTQGNALGTVRNQHSPRRGKRIKSSIPFPQPSWMGCYSFAPFGGVSMLHPLPPGVARGWHINAPFGA